MTVASHSQALYGRKSKILPIILIALTIPYTFFHFSGQWGLDLEFLGREVEYQHHGDGKVPMVDIQHLESLGLSRTIQYTRCDIAFIPNERKASFTKNLDLDLPPLQQVDLYSPEDSKLQFPTVIIQGPRPVRKADASSVIFGIATTLDRLDNSLAAMAYWAGGTKTRVFAIIEGNPDDDTLNGIKLVKDNASNLDIKLEITISSEDYNSRYFSLVKLLYDHHQDARWAAIIDDDTMILSINSLITRLDSYDPELPHYVGGISEDFVQMGVWGYMAYGGAGVFLSMPLLRLLNNEHVYQRCHNGTGWTGDSRIAHCIYIHTNTKLSVEHGLHQLDLHGDQSGFYESGRPAPLSIHHWKSWFPFNVTVMTPVSNICGEACLLQRWRFSNGWFLSNGFSIFKYQNDIPDGDSTMEKTWDDYSTASEESYVHSLAPLRGKDDSKVSYRLEDVLVHGDLIRQFYIQRAKDGGQDQVIEITWRQAHQE